MGVTLRQLEICTAVAQERHFGRAADALHVSQPVISQEVRRLEREIGATLFDRSTRALALTDIGAELLGQAQDIQRASQNFIARAWELSARQHARVRIAVTPSVVDRLLPAVLRRAESDAPNVLLEEAAVQTKEIPAALHDGGCDMGIGRFVHPLLGYRSETIRSEQALVAVSSRHPMATATAVNPATLRDLPLLLWSRERNPEYHDHLVRICLERGLTPRLSRSPPLIVGGRSYLIADGRAFGLIPESTATRVNSGITVLPLSEPATLPLSLV